MPQPARAPIATGPTEPASYVLERRLSKAYTHLLYHYPRRPESLCRIVWGPLTVEQINGRENRPGRLDRLDEHLPELILLLNATEQLALAAHLLSETPDLVAGIRYLLALDKGNGLKKRAAADPRLAVPDPNGPGRLSQQTYRNAGSFRPQGATPAPAPAPRPPVPVPVVPTPAPKPQPRPMLVVVELPKPKPTKRRPSWQPEHGLQLALWPELLGARQCLKGGL